MDRNNFYTGYNFRERKMFMVKIKISRYISLFLTASILSTGAGTGVSAAQDNNAETLNVLSRVIESENNGLLRYSYVNEDGEKQVLSSSAPDEGTGLRQASNLPSKYDLRTNSLSTSIKDQGVTGACWAFAAIKASESNSILKNITGSHNTDFSESHLTWYSYNGITERRKSKNE